MSETITRAVAWMKGILLQVAKLPQDLLDRRVEITGPPDRKMVINALNSGASVFMADFEDSNAPSWCGISRQLDHPSSKQRSRYTAMYIHLTRKLNASHPHTPQNQIQIGHFSQSSHVFKDLYALKVKSDRGPNESQRCNQETDILPRCQDRKVICLEIQGKRPWRPPLYFILPT